MRTVLIALVVAASLLVACNKTSSSSPASVSAKSGDPVTQKLQEVAGSGATDCGRVKSQAPEQTQKASECAMNAAKDKRAFYVGYDMPGLTVGVAGNSEGKLFQVQSEGADKMSANAKADVKSAPCPAELRVAQSGRVTCTQVGAMGAMGAGHGGMPPATGENPHGGMGAPPAGTQNPHASPQPAHPSGEKAPPKK